MAKITPELKQRLESMPNRTIDLIVRTRGDATPHLEWLADAGVQVKHQFRLSPGVAVSCTGQEALKLLDREWVISVEIDAPVSTQ